MAKIFPSIFCSHKYHKIVSKFIFEQVNKVFFSPKLVIKLSRVWVWDPRPGKTYSGSWIKKALAPDPQHWQNHMAASPDLRN
jgi:hypothetical protein